MKQLSYLLLFTFYFLFVMPSCKKDSDDSSNNNNNNTTTDIKDGDGNVYNSVKIGNQIWLKENLRTTKYKDGTAIPFVADASWGSLTTPAYCWYDNDIAENKSNYGALYNWYAVNTKKLCPTGWHVPSHDDWTALSDHLGGGSAAGGKLKEAGTAHWIDPNDGATNETGFTALPGGIRYSGNGSYNKKYNEGYWWSATESTNINKDPWFTNLIYDFPDMIQSFYAKAYGMSVRCVKD